VPPVWTSLLAVIAHPDDASSGLGAILDAFIVAGARAEVLCLTHGQAWALDGAPGDLAALRGAELVSAVDVLGVTHINVLDCPEGTLGQMCQTGLPPMSSPSPILATLMAYWSSTPRQGPTTWTTGPPCRQGCWQRRLSTFRSWAGPSRRRSPQRCVGSSAREPLAASKRLTCG
jgi:hypothetical protein